MKLITSLLVEKDREIANLKLELEALKADNTRLSADNTAYALGKRPTRQRGSEYGPGDLSSASAPSYTRPTAASMNRTKAVVDDAPVEEVFEHHTSHGKTVYADGQIMNSVDEWAQIPGYMKPTAAAETKESRTRHYHFLRRSKTKTDGTDDTESITSPAWTSDSWDVPLTPDESEVVHIEADEATVQTLADASRLQDTAFYSTPAGQVHIRLDKQLSFLKKAHTAAQDSLWGALRQRWPEAQKGYYLHGPRAIKFGRDELNSTIGRDIGQRLPGGVQSDIFKVVELRNAIAHPSTHKPSNLDSMMKQSQSLACELGDTTHAMRIRRLRDDLQQEATRTYTAILAYEALSHMPGGRPQPIHHQTLFSEVAFQLGYKYESEQAQIYGQEVVNAAKEWQLRRNPPGRDDPEYLANVEKRAAKIALTEVGDTKPEPETEDAPKRENDIAQYIW